MLFVSLCCATAFAEGDFAQVAIPEKIVQEEMRLKKTLPEWIDTVELHALPDADLVKLKAKYPTPKTLPRLRFQLPPIYPEALRKEGKTGRVVVYFVVKKDGAVGDIFVCDYTHPDFAKAAALAINRWLFQPGPAECVFKVSVPFSLESPKTESSTK